MRDLADVVARRLGADPAGLVRVGGGLDHEVFRLDDLLLRRALDPEDHAEVGREAALLAQVATFSPLPVPEVVFAEDGVLCYRRLPGRSLLEAPVGDPGSLAPALGEFLSALHAAPLRVTAVLVPSDVYPLAEWAEDAAADYRALRRIWLSPRVRSRIRVFLAAPPPPPPTRLAFCHADLGAEHLLTDGTRLTGVIDWSDAATADPARDLARLLRDLGPAVLERVLAHYDGPFTDADRARTLFYARCSLLEDLARGPSRLYRAAARGNLHHVFP